MSAPIHLYPRAMAKGSLDLLTKRFPQREIILLDDEPALLDALDSIEILYGLHTPRGHWAEAPNLRLIQSPGAGVDWLLPDPTLADDVVVCNATGVHEPAMPEFIIALLLAITKHIPTLVTQQRDHRWKGVLPFVLSGSTACVVGAGTIGQSVAQRLRAFGMRTTGVTRSGRPLEGFDQVVATADRHQLLNDANVVIVLSPLTDETVGLIGADDLAALPDGSYLVDASRGTITDLDAVVAALDSGKLKAAAIDVFPTEPLPEDSPYWNTPGLFLTPHTAGHSLDYFTRVATILEANLNALDGDKKFVNLVDRDRGY